MSDPFHAPWWFVRSVQMGDTHLGRSEQRDGSVVVWPACGGSRFVALNRWPIEECYYEDQPCPACSVLDRPAETGTVIVPIRRARAVIR